MSNASATFAAINLLIKHDKKHREGLVEGTVAGPPVWGSCCFSYSSIYRVGGKQAETPSPDPVACLCGLLIHMSRSLAAVFRAAAQAEIAINCETCLQAEAEAEATSAAAAATSARKTSSCVLWLIESSLCWVCGRLGRFTLIKLNQQQFYNLAH